VVDLAVVDQAVIAVDQEAVDLAIVLVIRQEDLELLDKDMTEVLEIVLVIQLVMAVEVEVLVVLVKMLVLAVVEVLVFIVLLQDHQYCIPKVVLHTVLHQGQITAGVVEVLTQTQDIQEMLV
jgi:hypothetical protein